MQIGAALVTESLFSLVLFFRDFDKHQDSRMQKDKEQLVEELDEKISLLEKALKESQEYRLTASLSANATGNSSSVPTTESGTSGTEIGSQTSSFR